MQGYTRRQLKQDKFAATAQEAAQWASGHKSPVVWTIVVVAIALLAGAGIWSWMSRQNEQANLALSGALRTFNAPIRPAGTPAGDTDSFSSIAERGRTAQKAFKAVADKYSSTKPGKLARYLEGVAAMQAGDNTAAEQQLKAAADAGNQDIAAMAKMALASLYRSTNRQSDAARIYKELADHPTETVSKAAAQLALAEMYENSDPQQATSLYQQIQKENPQGPAAQVAASKLSGGKQGGGANVNF